MNNVPCYFSLRFKMGVCEMQKIVLVVLLASTGFVGQALAADLIVSSPEPVAVSKDVFDWSGFYAGGQVGWATATFTSESEPATHQLDDFDPMEGSGWIAGLSAGFNHQLDNGFVLGIEGEVNWTDLSAEIVTSDPEWHANLDWYAALSAKAGVAAGKALFYGKAGVAVAGVTLSGADNVAPANSPVEASNTPFGAIVGVGAEVAVSDSFSLFAEADWVGLQAKDYDLTGTGYTAVESTDVGVGIIKVGAHFHM